MCVGSQVPASSRITPLKSFFLIILLSLSLETFATILAAAEKSVRA